ncbi:hypothetical protein IFM89_028837, partial [Coptis chinensis]
MDGKTSPSTSRLTALSFHPTDDEIIMYLKRMVCGGPINCHYIDEKNVNTLEPWDLLAQSFGNSGIQEWYLFSIPHINQGIYRATDQGYWKVTNNDGQAIEGNSGIIGFKKNLAFYVGHAPNGEKTDWIMHEYRLVDKDLAKNGYALDTFVLCKVFQEQYSRPESSEQSGVLIMRDETDTKETYNEE